MPDLDYRCPAGLSYLAAGLPHLLELDINGCNSITNVGLAAIARGLPLLRQLSLAAVHSHITDVGIRPLQQLHHLEGLQLSSCYNLTDRYAPKTQLLLKPRMGFPSLESDRLLVQCNLLYVHQVLTCHSRLLRFMHSALLLCCCRGLCELLAHMPHLTALDVRDCERITNLTLRAVVRYLPHLRSLNLEHCTKVSVAAPARCIRGDAAEAS